MIAQQWSNLETDRFFSHRMPYSATAPMQTIVTAVCAGEIFRSLEVSMMVGIPQRNSGESRSDDEHVESAREMLDELSVHSECRSSLL